jgi:hypothetical protein
VIDVYKKIEINQNIITLCPNLCGLFDIDKGYWIVEPQFISIGDPSDVGLMQFRDKHTYKAGYLNQEGKVVVQPIYTDAMDFKNGLAGVRLDGKWGFIDQLGNLVVPYQFYYVGDFFNDGYANAVKGESKSEKEYGFLDITGKYIKFQEGIKFRRGEFINDIAVVQTTTEGQERYGFMNRNGESIIKDDFIDITPFNIYGFSSVFMTDTSKYRPEKYGLIDKDGNFIYSFKFKYPLNFINGMALFSQEVNGQKKYGYLNSKGDMIVSAIYDKAGNFNNRGFASVSSEGRWGFINKNGEIIKTFNQNFLVNDSHYLSSFKEKDLYGFINDKGEIVIKPSFEDVFFDFNSFLFCQYSK